MKTDPPDVNSDRERPSQPTRRRRRLAFNLRTLMILVTLCAFGVFLKLQLDWYQKLWTAREWVKTLADGSVKINSSNALRITPIPSLPACPKPLSDEDQLEVLEIGSVHLKSEAERTAAIKLLVEMHPGAAHSQLRKVLTLARDPHLRSLVLRLIGLFRDLEDIALVSRHLDDADSEVRGAACDAIGIIRQPAFFIPLEGPQWLGPSCMMRSTPPIRLNELIMMVDNGGSLPTGAVVAFARLPDSLQELPSALRARLEQRMTSGTTSDERAAAARALVAWPPDNYRLRVAEWGVWINDDGEMKLAQSVIDEIPSFVHRTGNSFDSLKDRINTIMIVTRPIIHLTVDQPLAVDLEANITWGRPWFAYPMPDDFSVAAQMLQRPFHIEDSNYIEEELPTWLEQFDDDNIAALDDVREGFPWIHPLHRTVGGMGGRGNPYNQLVTIGVRWQSLVVLPSRQSWMAPPDATGVADPSHAWWRRLREVPSSWVSSRGESERFLYYDGPTLAKSPVRAKRVDGVLELSHQDMFPPTTLGARPEPTRAPPRRVNWLVQVEAGKVNAYPIPMGDSEADVSSDRASSPLKIDPSQLTPLEGDVTKHFVKTLVDQGLTLEEAAGMADVWRQQFFETPGQRLLTVLTREDYDALCPLKIRPTPTELVRVGIVLTELPSLNRTPPPSPK